MSRCRHHRVVAIVLTCAVLCGPALAGDRQFESVPEFDGYLKLSEKFRLFAPVKLTQSLSEGTSDGEIGVYLDVLSLKPIIREAFTHLEWERNQYLWARVGMAFAGIHEGLRLSNGYSEKRYVVELTSRYPMARDFWLVARARTDVRDLEGAWSNRYRLRVGLEKKYAAFGLTMVPYGRVEFSYDTRFDAVSRHLYQAGVEIDLSEHFRIEPYYAFQNDTRSSPAHLDRVGFILKYYR